MGIYDREYYRDDEGRAGWFTGNASTTKTLIAIHLALFLIGVFSMPGEGGASLYSFLVARSSAIFENFRIYQLLTAPFAPAPNNLLTVAFQMLILFWVGREMEPIYGSREFVWLYVMAAIFSTLGWAVFDYYGPGQGRGIYLGPGGMVAAILVLFTLYAPNREVLLFFVLPVKMWILLAVFLGFDAFNLITQIQQAGAGQVPGGSTLYFGHLAGAAYGWAYHAFGFRWTSFLNFDWLHRPRLRIVAPESHERGRSERFGPFSGARSSTSSPVSEEQLDSRVDEILAKIAREGRDSLTDEEQRILQEASRRARNRRSGRLS